MQDVPGAPTSSFGQGAPASPASPDQALWDFLKHRPTIAIPIPTTAASVKVFSGPCILDGWSLRETTGAAPALVEFIDGADATGVVIGEQAILAPATGTAGITDVEVDASSTGGAQANNCTLAGAAGATTFISGFEITGLGATAASELTITVTGILGGTKTYKLNIPVGVTVPVTALLIEYSRPIPASAVNTAIVVNVPSFGAGNTDAAATAHGFQRTLGASGAGAGQTASGPGGTDLVLVKTGIFLRVLAGSLTGSLWLKV